MSAHPQERENATGNGPRTPDLTVLPGMPRLAAEVARIKSDPAYAEHLRRLEEQAEAEQAEELRSMRRQNVWTRYAKDRPFEYVESCYARLATEQDPDRKVTGWWRSGAKNLLLVGQPGRGKTDAAYAVCNEVAADVREGRIAPVTVRAIGVAELRDVLTHVTGAHEARDEVASAERAARAREVREADLLLIDDITAANTTDAFRQHFHALMDYRVNAGDKRTVLTMNADAKELTTRVLDERLGAAIVSRIRYQCVAAWIEGPDRREWAKWDPFGEA